VNRAGTHLRVDGDDGAGAAVDQCVWAFDTVGTWGYALFALDDDGLLWSIKADGAAKVLQNFSNFGQGQGLKPEGIVVAPKSFGSFGGQLIITLQAAAMVLAIPPNMAGLPGLSIPCGLSEGLPVGLQLIGRQFSENLLFRAGHALERALDFDFVPERLR